MVPATNMVGYGWVKQMREFSILILVLVMALVNINLMFTATLVMVRRFMLGGEETTKLITTLEETIMFDSIILSTDRGGTK